MFLRTECESRVLMIVWKLIDEQLCLAIFLLHFDALDLKLELKVLFMGNLLQLIMEQSKIDKMSNYNTILYNINLQTEVPIMHFVLYLLALIVIKIQSTQLVGNLSFQILSKGQQIELPLQNYFQYANQVGINEQRSSPNLKEMFDVYMNDAPYQQVSTTTMTCQVSGKTLNLSNTQYYATKSLYNQPIKIFLLQNNVIMMYIYKENSDGSVDDNVVLCVNLTENLPQFYKGKKIACTSMDAQINSNQDIMYVSCRADETGRLYSFFLIELAFDHTQNGFVNGTKNISYSALINKTNICYEYSLKYFQMIKMNNETVRTYIFAFCKQKPAEGGSSLVFYFFRPPNIFNTSFFQINKCLINASYIAPNQNGFLSVINQRVHQYSTNANKGQSSCIVTDLINIDYAFAASRSYNDIDMTYFFLKNNTIIIKSSYRTNHQKLEVDRKGYCFTSYGLTEHFMALSMYNGSNTKLLIYSMQQLYPRLMDQKQIPGIQNSVLMSTSNYLQQGYYVFFYDNFKNELSLNIYNGYAINIKPYDKLFPSIQDQENEEDIDKIYTIVIQSHAQQLHQQMIINIKVRNFSNPQVVVYPIKPLTIDSPFINFNLSAMAVGPLKRFYLDTNYTDRNLKFQFINYYSTINISHILEQDDVSKPRGPRAVQKLKQIALNLQLKVMNPLLTLYYSTFIQNCALIYHRDNSQFQMECHPQDVIRFTSSIFFKNSKVIVLTKDKWLQYSNQSLEICTIIGESGVCQLLALNQIPIVQPIRKIKLVKFQSKSNGYAYIQIFIICDSFLQYGYFLRESVKKGTVFKYNPIFKISSKEVEELKQMVLTNIHFDKNYNNFLLLHLAKDDIEGVQHKALLYDHPNHMKNKFLGHLMHVFQDEEIESIMTIDNLIIIISNLNDGSAVIDQYRVTQFFSVYKTRTYPLYGRKITNNGTHVSDGQFLYIEAEVEKGEREGKTQYLVYCPALSTVNILTHILPKESVITFIQQIGSTKNRYPHSIGINGQNLFALSIPNLAVKFDYDAHLKIDKREKSKSWYCYWQFTADQEHCSQNIQKQVEQGNITLKLIDYKNIMHEINYKYIFDISGEVIKYSPHHQLNPSLNETSTSYSYELELDKISGPVMNYDINMANCSFVQKNIIFQDVFTKLQCLLPINSKQYGSMLDISLMMLKNGLSIQIIITTQYLMCVQNKQIKTLIKLNTSVKSCSITDDDNNKVLIICDDGQGSSISSFSIFGLSCLNYIYTPSIAKPSWLIYQYFKMMYQNPYVVFQIPIRIQSNMIYFLTTFDINKLTFSQKFLSLTHQKLDHFLTKDFQINTEYAFILEEGLGIYELEDSQLNTTTVQPLVWISKDKLGAALNTSSELVYIQPTQQQSITEYDSERRCSTNFSSSMYLQIGTTSHAYKVKICFNDDDDYIRTGDEYVPPQFQIFPILIFKQYKDCKNDELSESKNWRGLTIKLCVLQLQQYRIFANYMPITAKSSEYYMQFYKVNKQSSSIQTLYPFRMEKVTTNDSFQIKQTQNELIVRSLFNFLCYYKLSDKVTWTFSRNPNYTQNNDPNFQRRSCNTTVILKNQNFINKENSFFILNTDPFPNEKYKPWIFRSFFAVLTIISIIKYRLDVQHKKNKINKLRNNIISNQFQFRVRLNSKKQLQFDQMESSQPSP